jgi:hypothetical protein
MLTMEQLRVEASEDNIDTVVLAFTDMQGRLQGKRLSAEFFLEEVAEHYSEGCNYLLAVDVDMNTVDGYAMSSWDRGYGDFVLVPDMATLRRVPWHEGTAMVIADLTWLDGSPVVPSPRQILRAQVQRLADRGWTPMVGTELEFVVYSDSYEQAAAKDYRDLVPANQYNVDYSILGTSRIEPLLRRIRNEMAGAGLYVESAKGECNLGQHEIAFRYAEAVATCDNHSIYKTGAKEIAAQDGSSITFMAKPNAREGNSCHIHLSIRGAGGEPVMAGQEQYGMSKLGEHFLADAGTDTLLRAQHQLLQAVRARQLRPHLGPLGAGQPDLRAAPGRARRGAAGGEPRPRRGREPLPGRRRDDRRGPARHRQRAAAGAGRRGQRIPRHFRKGAAHPARRARAVAEERPGPPGVRARRRGALRQLRQRGADRLRRGGDRLGATALLRAPLGLAGPAARSPSIRERWKQAHV